MGLIVKKLGKNMALQKQRKFGHSLGTSISQGPQKIPEILSFKN
jgi:hypothetical protein